MTRNKRQLVEESGDWQLRSLSIHDERRTNDEVHSTIDVCPVMAAMMDQPEMQRLKRISQLGVASQVYVNAEHHRFEHSLGVAHLASKVARRLADQQPQLQIDERDELCLTLAGLLHDISHGPNSHVFESFLRQLPLYIEFTPGAAKAYAELEPIPEGWSHEDGAIMMVTAMLCNMGLEINMDNLDEPLKQIGSGIDARSMRVFSRRGADDDKDILTSRDFVFILECITGKPVTGDHFIGRPREKEFLYQIVNNVFSGLDVDKIDYFARDAARCFRHSGEIDKILVEEARVAWGICPLSKCFQCDFYRRCGHVRAGEHLMIVYPTKIVPEALDFFRKRLNLHTKIYQHKTTVAAELLMNDILFEADLHFRIRAKPEHHGPGPRKAAKTEHDSLPISRAMLSPTAYTNLTDHVFSQIAGSTEQKLQNARRLIQERLEKRNLYKCVSSMTLNMATQAHIWIKGEKGLLQEMLAIKGNHTDKDGKVLTVESDDFVVNFAHIHYGKKDENPLLMMRFYKKNQSHLLTKPIYEGLPDADTVDESEHESLLPRVFQKCTIRIYCRDPAKEDLVRHVFELWRLQVEGELGAITEEPNENTAAHMVVPLSQGTPLTTPLRAQNYRDDQSPIEVVSKKQLFSSSQAARF